MKNKATEINVEKIVHYWVEMSNRDFDTMIDFYNIKRYNWSLFIGIL